MKIMEFHAPNAIYTFLVLCIMNINKSLARPDLKNTRVCVQHRKKGEIIMKKVKLIIITLIFALLVPVIALIPINAANLAIEEYTVEAQILDSEATITNLMELLAIHNNIKFLPLNGESIKIDSEEIALWVMNNAKPGDKISVPFSDVISFCCNNCIVSITNEPSENKSVIFIPSNDDSNALFFNTIDELMSFVYYFNEGDIISISYDSTFNSCILQLDNSYNCCNELLTSRAPGQCQGGLIPFRSELVHENFRFHEPTRQFYCFEHIVRVSYHCPCGRSTQTATRTTGGCGRVL